MTSRFSAVPSKAVEDKEIGDKDLRLLAVYGIYGNKEGWCWPAQQTIADIMGVSRKWVNERTQFLVEAGYLQMQHRYGNNGAQLSNMYRVILDYPVTSVEEICTPPVTEVEGDGYTNTPLNTPYNTGTDVPDGLSIDWQIAAGKKAITLPNQKDAEYTDSANLIAMTFGGQAEQAFAIAYIFMKTRGILIPQSKIKGQRKAVKEMLEMGVTAANVEAAVKQLLSKKMTVADLYSVSKTAISLANPAKDNKPKKFSNLDEEKKLVE